MGYTSNVAIRLTTQTKAQMNNLLDMLEVKLNTVLKDIYENTDHEHYFYIQKLLEINYDSDNETTLTNSSIKWYEDLPDIKVVMDWLQDIDDSDPDSKGDIAAQYIRIGEDVDDDSERTYGNPIMIGNWMYISRHIEF